MKIEEIYRENKEKFLTAFGRSFFSDVVSLSLITFAGIILLSVFLIIVLRVKGGDSLVPLAYNSTFGVTVLGSWFKLYLYPLVYLCFSLLNIFIAWAFFEKERLITYLSLFINIILGVLFIIIVYNLTVLTVG